MDRVACEKSVDAETVVAHGVRQHFDRHIDSARAHAEPSPAPFRGDASLAHHNARVGLDAVLAARAALEATGLRVDWAALATLPELGLALVYAAEQVAGFGGANADYQKTYARARIVRDIGMSSVETLVKSGDLTAADLKRLRKGASPLHLAGELDGLARFFAEKGEVFRGKSPFTAALAREAAQLGAELMRVVTPKGGRKAPSSERAEGGGLRPRRAGGAAGDAPRGARPGGGRAVGARARGARAGAAGARGDGAREEARGGVADGAEGCADGVAVAPKLSARCPR